MPGYVVGPALPLPRIDGLRRRRIGDGDADDQEIHGADQWQQPQWMFAGTLDNRLPLRCKLSDWRQIVRRLACRHQQIGVRGSAVSRYQDLGYGDPKVVRCGIRSAFDESSTDEKKQDQANSEYDTDPDRIARKPVVGSQCPGCGVRFRHFGGAAVHERSRLVLSSRGFVYEGNCPRKGQAAYSEGEILSKCMNRRVAPKMGTC